MFKQLLNGQIKTITSAAVIIGTASLVSRLLGVFRDRILAGEFGAGAELDMYYAAFRIPDLVFNLLVLGALSAGFIPVFTMVLRSKLVPERSEAELKGSDELKFYPSTGSGNKILAWQLANSILNILGLALIIICGLLIIIAPWLTKLVVPGFTPEQMQITTNLARIMFLSPIFLGFSSVFGGILQTFRRFFVYSLAPIMYNIGIIIGALYFVGWFGIYGLAWGVVLGAFLHLLIQIPTAVGVGFRYRPFFDFANQQVRQIFRLMVPRTLALAISQVNLVVITIIASTLATGSLAIFNFANNLQSLPIGLFGISFAIAAFPALADWASEHNQEKFTETFSSTVRQIMFFIIPATVLFLVLRAQIVRVVLGAGRFDWEDTVLTINSLQFFTLSLFAQALIPFLARAFYAFQDTLTPFLIGLVSFIINVGLSFWLAGVLGVEGLALAFTISSILNLVLLWVGLHLRAKHLGEGGIIISVFKVSAAALGMGVVAQVMKFAIEPYVGTGTFLGIFSQGLIASLAGLAVFVILALLLRSPEMIVIGNSFKRRFLKAAPTPAEIDGR